MPKPLPPTERDPWPAFLRTMAWIGVNSFGGPVAQIGVMREVAVEQRRWLSDAEFLHVLSFANALPGPEALEIVIHLGRLRRGVAGGIVAGLLFIAPGFLSLAALAYVYQTWGQLPAIQGFLDGVRPVAAALVVFAVVRLASKALRGRAALALMLMAFAAHRFAGVPFVPLLLGCGAVGVLLAERRRGLQEQQAPTWAVLALVACALALGWAQGNDGRLAVTAPTLAAAPVSALAAAVDGGDRLWPIALVELQAALVTFGGAYTVLPFLREQMVDVHGWVTDEQVMDALALGETTPGPLVSVGVFLAWIAGGPLAALVGGFFLFLPSFVLVLGLGRQAERVDALPRSRDFLYGVSAGTIGLVLALSAQVVPGGLRSPWQAALAVVAFLAVWRLRVDALPVVLAGGLLGAASRWFG